MRSEPSARGCSSRMVRYASCTSASSAPDGDLGASLDPLSSSMSALRLGVAPDAYSTFHFPLSSGEVAGERVGLADSSASRISPRTALSGAAAVKPSATSALSASFAMLPSSTSSSSARSGKAGSGASGSSAAESDGASSTYRGGVDDAGECQACLSPSAAAALPRLHQRSSAQRERRGNGADSEPPAGRQRIGARAERAAAEEEDGASRHLGQMMLPGNRREFERERKRHAWVEQ